MRIDLMKNGEIVRVRLWTFLGLAAILMVLEVGLGRGHARLLLTGGALLAALAVLLLAVASLFGALGGVHDKSKASLAKGIGHR